MTTKAKSSNWWEEYHNAGELKRIDLTKKIVEHSKLKDVQKITKDGFVRLLNSYFDDLDKYIYEQGKKDACKRIRHVLIDDDYLDQRISFFEWLADYEKGKELSKDG
jgi:hypothetical protein